MKLYFGGSEVKMWRDLLAEEKIDNVALSYVGLLRRNKGNVQITTDWSISGHYPDNQNIFLDSGAFTLNKEDSDYTIDDANELAVNYMNFVTKNIDRVSLVSEFDAQILGRGIIEELRKSFYDNLPIDKFMPIWHAEYGVEELERLCSTYAIVGIPTTDIGDKSLIPLLNGYVNRYGVRLHGVAITGRKLLKEVKWDSVASMSWLSPTRFGDTIIWVGNELKRYPKAYKERARKQHGEYLKRHNFDLDKIQNEDGKEILRLSLWSWSRFIENLDKRVTMTARKENDNSAESGYLSVDTHRAEKRNDHLLPAIPETSAFEIALRGSEGSAKTIEQRKVLLSALIDMQGQRVLELKKLEDQEGGFADINLSSELDRLVRFVKTQNEMEKQSFSLKIEASAPAGEGFMSSMFGSNVGEKLAPEETKTTATHMPGIEDKEVHEAEIVDD